MPTELAAISQKVVTQPIQKLGHGIYLKYKLYSVAIQVDEVG